MITAGGEMQVHPGEASVAGGAAPGVPGCAGGCRETGCAQARTASSTLSNEHLTAALASTAPMLMIEHNHRLRVRQLLKTLSEAAKPPPPRGRSNLFFLGS